MAVQTVISCLVAVFLGLVKCSDPHLSSSRSQARENYPFGQSYEAPEYEIVVARYRENQTTLAWLAEVPTFYQITIINKGGWEHPMPELPPGKNYVIVNATNQGREGDTFAGHLVRRYESMASYTIFSQADPFPHNEYFLELLKHPATLGKVQTLSRLYLAEGEFETPKAAVDAMSKHPYYRSERFSMRTLNSIWYHDEGSINVMWGYWRAHNLEPGTNLIAHHFKLIGLPDWIPEAQEVGAFSFGALVGFERSTVLQHPKYVYEKLQESTWGDWSNNFIVERIWSMLFAGPDFKDV